MLYSAFSAVKVKDVSLFARLQSGEDSHKSGEDTHDAQLVRTVTLKVVRHIQELIYNHVPAKE